MAPLNRIEQPKTHRGRKILLEREAKVAENQKRTVFLRSASASQKSMQVLKDFYSLKKPEALLFTRNKQDPDSFEDPSKIERLCAQKDASLFSLAKHSKKKPHSLLCGRLFNGQILDMFEFSIEDVKPISNYLKTLSEGTGNKPLLVFAGEEFERTKNSVRLKNFLTDYFRGNVVDRLSLQGVKYVISFFLNNEILSIRPYCVQLLKSGLVTPRVELLESGPIVDMRVTRMKLATDDLYYQSLKQPKEATKKKQKNVSMDEFRSRLGRVHMERQDFNKLQLRKVKLYRKMDGPNAGLPQNARERMSKKKSNESSENDVVVDSD